MKLLTGVSTLYLAFLNEPYEKVFSEILAERVEEEKPEVWEIVDIGEHSLNKERVKGFIKLLDQGCRFTVHCPWDVSPDLCHDDSGRRREALKRMMMSIDFTGEMEASIWVLHSGLKPKPSIDDRLAKSLNEDSIATLYDHAESAGLKLGLENNIPAADRLMTRPSDFSELVESIGIDLKIVFDPGHAEIRGLVKDFVQRLAERFLEVHVHDNNGGSDEHLDIGEGSIDWRSITSELSRRGFDGIYAVESIRQPFKSLVTLRSMLPKPLSPF